MGKKGFIKFVIAGLAIVQLVACSSTAPVTDDSKSVEVHSMGNVDKSPQELAAMDKKAREEGNFPVSRYLIGVDDIVKVSVWKNENMSVTVPVRPDGMISIPLAGDVLAGGLTPNQVAASIRQKLKSYIRDPQVTVILTQLRSHDYLSRVRVTGAVRNPISVPFRQGMTVLDVVLAAGGTTEFASPNGTRLYRKHDGKNHVFKIRLGDILNKGKLKTNIDILPGDVVTVPERLF